ncbi:mycothiol system anti-sigma-R factor [Streptomyces sp. KR80]|uniref:mycothiol system anti-sigma-R factor n=1 Tax=Streptomyces sp. KR80 TaxID=3457426 RepID=UPI003FD3F258
MSCGQPHETDCSEVLDHLYEFLDREMPEGDCAKFEVHFDECSPCLEKYGLEQAVKKLVKRCCGHDDVPADLRSKVMGRIELIRAGEAVPEQSVMEQAVADQRAAEARKAQQDADASSPAPARAGDSASRRGLSEPGQA